MRDKMEHALHKYKDRSHLPFFIIFCLFLACRVLLTIPAWTNEALIIIKPIKTDLQSGFIWGAVLYTTYLILSSGWRPWKIAGLLAILASAAPLLYVPLENSRNFDVIMSAVLIGLSFGRSFHRIIRLMLITYVSALVVSVCGVIMGMTTNGLKIETYGKGLSLGTNHPNLVAFLIFEIIILLWYLYLKDKKALYTFLTFWTIGLLVMLITKCRTITAMLMLFPLCAALFRKIPNARTKEKKQPRFKWLTGTFILMPVICWGITFLLATQMDALEHFTRGTFLHNPFVRFIQTGVAVKEYGFSFFPQNIALDGSVYAILDGNVHNLILLDNTYAYYTLEYGLVYIAAALAWFCITNKRCVRETDYSLLLIAVFFSIYELMERVPFQIGFNLLYFYPVTALKPIREDPL